MLCKLLSLGTAGEIEPSYFNTKLPILYLVNFSSVFNKLLIYYVRNQTFNKENQTSFSCHLLFILSVEIQYKYILSVGQNNVQVICI